MTWIILIYDTLYTLPSLETDFRVQNSVGRLDKVDRKVHSLTAKIHILTAKNHIAGLSVKKNWYHLHEPTFCIIMNHFLLGHQPVLRANPHYYAAKAPRWCSSLVFQMSRTVTLQVQT